MIGRWKSGAPIDLTPLTDDPGLGADPNRNNNFDYSHPGFLLASDQSHCPFAAHIRKTRPRADLGNTNVQNQAIRAGIPYGPEVGFAEMRAGATRRNRGLAFGKFFGFERFELIELLTFVARMRSGVSVPYRQRLPVPAKIMGQQHKVCLPINPACFQNFDLIDECSFPFGKTQTVGHDPIIGQAGNNAPRTTFGINPFNTTRSYSIPEFITPRGGEYFFSPSITALKSTIAA